MKDLKHITTTDFLPFQSKIASIFDKMDAAYDVVADHYGFQCRGCKDNCCLTRFYHHTLLEYLYLREGFYTLSEARRNKILSTAGEVVKTYENSEGIVRVMCPLNEKGLCTLYTFRPMICRLHGIPNELRRPDGKAAKGPGCEAFTGKHGSKPYFPLDRTPFYIELAQTEKNLKETLGISIKLKLTISEMLISYK